MRYTIQKLFGLGLAVLTLGCDSNPDKPARATALEFSQLIEHSTELAKQHFQFDAAQGEAGFISAAGALVTFNVSDFYLNGDPLSSGIIDVEFIELYDRAEMAVTNRPTIGYDPVSGNRGLLLSGGEFYFSASSNGQLLHPATSVNIRTPASLTGGVASGMSAWNLDEDNTWIPAFPSVATVDTVESTYRLTLNYFGWVNVDVFEGSSGNKTFVNVKVPSGYNKSNSQVLLICDELGNALMGMDTFRDGYFTEHSEHIPVGLNGYLLFLSEENGLYKYALKPITVTDDQLIPISDSETSLATRDELIALIQSL